jgi:hypothetical protein
LKQQIKTIEVDIHAPIQVKNSSHEDGVIIGGLSNDSPGRKEQRVRVFKFASSRLMS